MNRRLGASGRLVVAGLLATLMGLGVVLTSAPAASADTYNPPPGVKLSSPVSSPYGKYVILNHVLRTIRSVPKGQKIRIMTWNLRSDAAVKALVDADRRGVSVQVVVDRENANPDMEIPNPGFFYLQRELARGNASRPPGMKSYAVTCSRSCRGKYGIAHAKIYLFSQAFRTSAVTMYGSFNLTDNAAKIQWNDLYTVAGNKNLYNWTLRRFNEAVQDKPLAAAWATAPFGRLVMGLFPYYGNGASGDPVIKVLNQVKCTGATGGTGNNGRTVIRIAQTSEAYTRGEAIARKLKSLWDSGCDIKMLSAIYGNRDRTIYKAPGPHGPMPFRQLAVDFDGDGLYDRYLHTKVMTISGNWQGITNATFTWNGSSNWEAYVLNSDDTFVRVWSASLVAVYNKFINYWFNHIPQGTAARYDTQARILSGQLDPYQGVEVN